MEGEASARRTGATKGASRRVGGPCPGRVAVEVGLPPFAQLYNIVFGCGGRRRTQFAEMIFQKMCI